MREIFTYGSVGRAPGNRCLYPEDGQAISCGLDNFGLVCAEVCFKLAV